MTTLLVIIFITFVGVGLPDSVLGTAWPAMYQEFGLPISLNGYISAIISIGTIISSFFAARLIHRFGTGLVTAVSTLLTALALFGFALTKNPILFFFLALPLGLGAGAIDTGLNSFVALHYNAAQMSFLHCSYGAGVAASPFIMSLALGNNEDWRRGYLIVATLQCLLTVIAFLALPLWKKVQQKTEEEGDAEQKVLSFSELFKIPAVRLSCFAFFSACALELTVGMWCSSYFVEAKGASPDKAAIFTMVFYLGLTSGRLLSGLFANVMGRRKIIKTCLGILVTALILFSLPLPIVCTGVGLFFIGLGIGPVYPNLMHLTPKLVGEDIAQSAIGAQQSLASIGVLVMPWLFGVLAEKIAMEVMPIFLGVMYVLFLYSFLSLLKESKKHRATS